MGKQNSIIVAFPCLRCFFSVNKSSNLNIDGYMGCYQASPRSRSSNHSCNRASHVRVKRQPNKIHCGVSSVELHFFKVLFHPKPSPPNPQPSPNSQTSPPPFLSSGRKKRRLLAIYHGTKRNANVTSAIRMDWFRE